MAQLCQRRAKLNLNLFTLFHDQQLGDLLRLYIKHAISDLETYKAVAKILENENRFISQQAYNFLKESKLSDKEIKKLK